MDRRVAMFAAAVALSIEKPAMPMPSVMRNRKQLKRELKAARQGMKGAPGGWKKYARQP